MNQAKRLIARGARMSADFFEEEFICRGVRYTARFSGITENFELEDAGIDLGGGASMRVLSSSIYTPKLRDEIRVRGKLFYVSEISPLPAEGYKCNLKKTRK